MKTLKLIFAMILMATGSFAMAQSLAAAKPAAPAPASVKDICLSEKDDVFAWERNADGTFTLRYVWSKPAVIYAISMAPDQHVLPGRPVMVLNVAGRSKASLKITQAMHIKTLNPALVEAQSIGPNTAIMTAAVEMLAHDSVDESNPKQQKLGTFAEMLTGMWQSTGLYDVIRQSGVDFSHTWSLGLGRIIMIVVGCVLIYLAIFKGFEPLLLLPIGFGGLLANIPVAAMAGPDGLLGQIYTVGIESGVFPLLIFMGVGAMTDFGPLIANPVTALLGAAAQFGIFAALLGALLLSRIGIDFDLKDAASIGIIGGADGPTSIYLTTKLSPKLLGAIAVAAYSYMALVPIIQPPIMKLCTTVADRKIKMHQLRHVSKLEKICFPVLITLLCAMLLPDAAPLIGMLMFGNLMRECGVVDRLSSTAQNALINIVTIFLGLAVGSKLSADKFLNVQTLGILMLGLMAFVIATATGVLFGQVMKFMSGGKINPLIGAAGVSAVPMSARVVNKVGLEADPHNFLLMHAMGPNVSGVIGSAVAAGALLKALGGL